MSKSGFLRAGFTGLASITLIGCATTATTPQTAAAETGEFAKPTAEEIALISRAEPLAQVHYWNEQYNLHPVDLDISLALTRALRRIGSYERAAEVASLAVVSHPQSAEMYSELGRANASQGKAREAIRAFNNALTIAPNEAYPYAAVGIILDREGQHVSAQKAYEEALIRQPERPVTLSNYGLSLALTGNLQAAEDKFRNAVALPGASATIRQNFALILGLQGKFDEARQVALQDAPDGIAERNTDFLIQMIGDNPSLQAISDIATGQDIPQAAPTQTVQSAALEPSGSTAEAQTNSAVPKRRPRRARRSALVSDGLN